MTEPMPAVMGHGVVLFARCHLSYVPDCPGLDLLAGSVIVQTFDIQTKAGNRLRIGSQWKQLFM